MKGIIDQNFQFEVDVANASSIENPQDTMSEREKISVKEFIIIKNMRNLYINRIRQCVL